MKKQLLILMAAAAISTGAAAQTDTPTDRYSVATNSFWSNWFVEANLSGTAFWGDQENFAANPFDGFRHNAGFSVAIGKWFTPGLGLRTKFNGVWGRSVISKDVETNAAQYFTIHEQALINLSNLLCGYSDTRVWNVIPFIGVGLGRNMSYDSYALGLSVGLLNQWRLSRHVAVNFEVGYGLYESDFDGFNARLTDNGLRSKDQTLSAEVGITLFLGKAGFHKVPDVSAMQALSQSQIDALNRQLADAQAENDQLRKQVAQQKPAETNEKVIVKEGGFAPVSVFFNINKTNMASRKDLQNVEELVKVARQAGRTIVVTGYADSCTGSAALNQRLSERRAETVAKEIEKMGVSRSDMEVSGKGGVNTLSPCPYNRRVVVSVK